jgi:chromosome partitioning protein
MIINIINNKGGTGKTTTCVNLASALAKLSYRVLIVDLDSQASASISLGYEHDDLEPSIADVLFDQMPLENAIRITKINNLWALCGNIELANSDLILAESVGREEILHECFRPIKGDYDFILLDSPPSLSTIFINALVASDYYIVPITPDYLSLDGFMNLMRIIKKIENEMGIETSMLGVLFTMMNPRMAINRKISREIIGVVKERYGDYVFKTKIVRSAMVSEAPSQGLSIFEYAPRSAGAKEYMMFAHEVLERCDSIIRAKEVSI